jgi:hypothetical protein
MNPGEERALYTVEEIPKERMYYTNETTKTTDYSKLPPTQLRDVLSVPTTFEQAVYHHKKWIRDNWKTATDLELSKMKSLKVWHVANKKDIPQNRQVKMGF